VPPVGAVGVPRRTVVVMRMSTPRQGSGSRLATRVSWRPPTAMGPPASAGSVGFSISISRRWSGSWTSGTARADHPQPAAHETRPSRSAHDQLKACGRRERHLNIQRTQRLNGIFNEHSMPRDLRERGFRQAQPWPSSTRTAPTPSSRSPPLPASHHPAGLEDTHRRGAEGPPP
jgi:hypothetical protein